MTSVRQSDRSASSSGTPLEIAREALNYVLEHHLDRSECLCAAGRSVVESALSLTEDAAKREAREIDEWRDGPGSRYVPIEGDPR